MEFNKKTARTWSKLGLVGALGSIGLPYVREKNSEVCLLSADVFGLKRFSAAFPEDYFDVGIAEQNMIGISAGLASEGRCVFATAYASFLTSRAHEFVRQNLGYLQYNVNLIGFSAGVSVGTSGVSHWSIDDIALMRLIPGMTVLSAADAMEAVKMTIAAAENQKPCYIRLCGGQNVPIIYQEDYDFQIGKGVTLREGDDVAVIATGLLVKESLEAAELLRERGISCTVVNMHTIKPLDKELLEKIYRTHKLVVTVEEHNIVGGLGGAVAEHKTGFVDAPRQVFMGITDEYKKTGTRAFILEQYGLTSEKIAGKIEKELKR